MYEVTIQITGKRSSLHDIGYAIDAYTGIWTEAALDNFSGLEDVDMYRLEVRFTLNAEKYPELYQIENMLLDEDTANVLVERAVQDKEEDIQPFCPLLSIDNTIKPCQEIECAWWDDIQRVCSVLGLSEYASVKIAEMHRGR